MLVIFLTRRSGHTVGKVTGNASGAMFKKLSESEIDPANPWRDDKLGRQPIADRLTAILQTVEQPLVVSVNAPFGMGKTFFAKRWHSDLLKRGKTAVYFNAWETDYCNEPLVAIIERVKSSIAEIGLPTAPSTPIGQKLAGVVKQAAPSIARIAVNATVGILTLGTVKDVVDTAGEVVAQAGLTELEKIATTSIEAFSTETTARRAFRAELESLRDAIRDAKRAKANGNGESDSNIYILIDELDRCKPTYALELLEAAKHLFNVPGFVFLLFVNDNAIQASAKAIYGTPDGGEDYLRKFIDWRFSLPRPSYRQMAEYLFDFYSLSEVTGDETDSITGKAGYVQAFALYANHFGMSLRSQAQAFAIINAVIRSQQRKPIAPILVALCIGREAGFSNWSRLKAEKSDGPDLARFLGYETSTNHLDSDIRQYKQYHDLFLQVFLIGLNQQQMDPNTGAGGLLQHFQSSFTFRHGKEHEIVSYLCNEIEFAGAILK